MRGGQAAGRRTRQVSGRTRGSVGAKRADRESVAARNGSFRQRKTTRRVGSRIGGGAETTGRLAGTKLHRQGTRGKDQGIAGDPGGGGTAGQAADRSLD